MSPWSKIVDFILSKYKLLSVSKSLRKLRLLPMLTVVKLVT